MRQKAMKRPNKSVKVPELIFLLYNFVPLPKSENKKNILKLYLNKSSVTNCETTALKVK